MLVKLLYDNSTQWYVTYTFFLSNLVQCMLLRKTIDILACSCDKLHTSSMLCLYRFLLPASLIVINDIAAYLFGFFLGRTPLIKLSPKKTWEGFIGASVTTIISAFLVRWKPWFMYLGDYYYLQAVESLNNKLCSHLMHKMICGRFICNSI